jgi:hypothetical protein
MTGEKLTNFDHTQTQADSPVVSSLREKLIKNPPTNYGQLRKLEDLTPEEFSGKWTCTIDQAKKIFTIYKQLSTQTLIPLRICDSIMKLTGESVPIFTNRLTNLVKEKTTEPKV